MANKSNYARVWSKLEDMGFERGNDIQYILFCEACEDAGVEADDIDLDDFGETYDVNIG